MDVVDFEEWLFGAAKLTPPQRRQAFRWLALAEASASPDGDGSECGAWETQAEAANRSQSAIQVDRPTPPVKFEEARHGLLISYSDPISPRAPISPTLPGGALGEYRRQYRPAHAGRTGWPGGCGARQAVIFAVLVCLLG